MKFRFVVTLDVPIEIVDHIREEYTQPPAAVLADFLQNESTSICGSYDPQSSLFNLSDAKVRVTYESGGKTHVLDARGDDLV